jgi:hypothetical protein
VLAASAGSAIGNPGQFDFVLRRLGKRPLAIDRKNMGEPKRRPALQRVSFTKKGQFARRIAAARQRLGNASRLQLGMSVRA